MSDFVSRIGVQSYCFRNFKDNKTVAQMVRDCGLNRIELCAVHANFQQPETFDEVIGVYRDAGVQIGSIGVEGFAGNEAADRNRFAFAKKAGAQAISVNFDARKFPLSHPVAGKLADEFGIKLAIHNHGGHHWLGNNQMLECVFETVSPSIGLCCDTAWALDAGLDPVAMMEKFSGRLYGIHFKDFTFASNRKSTDVPVGEGNLDLKAALALLDRINYQGYAVYEYEGDPTDPIPAVKKCVANMQAAAAG